MNPITASFSKSYSRKKDNKSMVYVQTILKRERVQFFTGIYVLPSEWDCERECVKDSTLNAKDCNLIINNIKARITEVFVRYRLTNDVLIPELSKKEYKIQELAEKFHNRWYL